MGRPRITDLSLEDLEHLARKAGVERYRANQAWHWMARLGVTNPRKMANLPEPFRQRLLQETHAEDLLCEWFQDPAQQTEKCLLTLPDGLRIEAVLIMEPKRTTVCLSSQAGCPVGCLFCASGASGLLRNLSHGEILDQFHALQNRARDLGRRITNVVMMGMGEPMLNMGATLRAMRIMNDRRSIGIGARRITLSTVGLKKGLARLREEGKQYSLAISLHAPHDALRRELIPFQGALSVQELVHMARDHFASTGREVTFEYILLKGINDKLPLARALASLLRGVRCTVNLIPYNENPGFGFSRPAPEQVERFANALREEHQNVSLRKQKGNHILAACGQLSLRRQRPEKPDHPQNTPG